MPGEHLYDGVLSHSLVWMGLAFMTGHATWRLAVQADDRPLPYEAAFFRGGAALALAGAAAELRHTTLSMAETLSAENVREVLTASQFGQGWLLLNACLLAMVALWTVLRWRTGIGQQPLLWAPAAGVVLAQCSLGHAAAGGSPWLLGVYGVHTLAMMVWLGGLLVWVATLSTGYRADRLRPLQAFSRLAGLTMAIGLPSGLLIAASQVPRAALLASAYGAVLGAKVALVAAILAIAAGHRLWRLARLERDPFDPAAWASVESRLFWEVVLAVAVVMAAAGLSQLPPPG